MKLLIPYRDSKHALATDDESPHMDLWWCCHAKMEGIHLTIVLVNVVMQPVLHSSACCCLQNSNPHISPCVSLARSLSVWSKRRNSNDLGYMKVMPNNQLFLDAIRKSAQCRCTSALSVVGCCPSFGFSTIRYHGQCWQTTMANSNSNWRP